MATKVTLRQIALMRKLILAGYYPREIAEDLKVSVGIVRTYTKAERNLIKQRSSRVS